MIELLILWDYRDRRGKAASCGADQDPGYVVGVYFCYGVLLFWLDGVGLGAARAEVRPEVLGDGGVHPAPQRRHVPVHAVEAGGRAALGRNFSGRIKTEN